MARKRYVFVHLAIFASICCTFAVAGISSYRDFVKARDGDVAARPAPVSPAKEPASAGKRGSPTVLALDLTTK